MILRISFLLLLIFEFSFAQKKLPINVGVSSFNGTPETEEQLKLLTDRLRDELLQTGVWQILESDKASDLNQEKAAAQAGCFESSCFAELGMELGLEKVVLPIVFKTAGIWTLQAKLVNVKSGRIEKMVLVDSKAKFKDLLKNDVKTLAEKLTDKKSGSDENVALFDSTLTSSPIAVLELDGNGIPPEEIKGLTDRFRAELFNTGRFEVMEREQLNLILAEQAFQQTSCSGDDCMVEMGKLAGVEFMVGGSVSRIGSMFSVSARLIDVATGRIVRTATIDLEASMEKVLKETMNDVARTLTGQKIRERTRVAAWVWTGTSLTIAGVGGWFFYQGTLQHDKYDKEKFDLDALRNYKDEAILNYWIAGAAGGVSLIALGIATWEFVREDKKIRSQNLTPDASEGASIQVYPLPGGAVLSYNF
jgi:TolB-like protein